MMYCINLEQYLSFINIRIFDDDLATIQAPVASATAHSKVMYQLSLIDFSFIK